MTPLCKDCLHMKKDNTMRERCYSPDAKYKGVPCNIERIAGVCGETERTFQKREAA